MKKYILFSMFLLSACAYEQNIYAYKKIDTTRKTVAISAANLSEMHQALKQALMNAGYKLYVKNDNKDSGYTRQTSQYELSDNIIINPSVSCGVLSFENGYSYAISFIDLKTSEEVFSMQGKGCYSDILDNFVALINNRYSNAGMYNTVSDTEQPRTPVLQIGGLHLWNK